MVEGKLFKRTRDKTAYFYLKDRLGGRLSPSTVAQFGIVQRRFSREAVEAFGPIRLYRLIHYLARTHKPIPRTKAKLDTLRIALPGDSRTTVLKLFSQCTERDIKKACAYADLQWATDSSVTGPMLKSLANAIFKATSWRVRADLAVDHGRPVLKLAGIPADFLEHVAREISRALREQAERERGQAPDPGPTPAVESPPLESDGPAAKPPADPNG